MTTERFEKARNGRKNLPFFYVIWDSSKWESSYLIMEKEEIPKRDTFLKRSGPFWAYVLVYET